MERIDWIVMIAVVILLALFVFDRAVFADEDEIAAATDVISVTEVIQLRTENAELKQQVTVLSVEVQELTLRANEWSIRLAESRRLLANLYITLREAFRAKDWMGVHQAMIQAFEAIHQFVIREK